MRLGLVPAICNNSQQYILFTIMYNSQKHKNIYKNTIHNKTMIRSNRSFETPAFAEALTRRRGDRRSMIDDSVT